ncbi:MAG TPA: acetamidase/formamidase family protein [Spirochaetales bacterium]|nr:acetamidase/formamidase family protein [Spirochaetales bacterium]
MITPEIRGGHEVTVPVAVEGAEVGDAVVIHIRDITITSLATASGNDQPITGRFLGDPFIAGEAKRYASMPDNSIQNSILTFAPHDLVGLAARLRPFMGQIGTTPAIPIPDSHNAGDFGVFLINASHEYAITEEQLVHRTDGHMDINVVRAGAILICPVKTPGAGIYGEIAGHTCNVAGTVTIEGPIVFPLLEDLPYLARPLDAGEKYHAQRLARLYGIPEIEESLPVCVIGTGPDLNKATDNGLERAAKLFGMSVPEVKNRATITGAIKIGRHPGVIQVISRVPVERLEKTGLLDLAIKQYGEP